MRILLLGSYGRGNIGDDAFLIAATKLLKNNQISINAANDAPLPESVRQMVTVLNTEGSEDWWQKVKALLKTDVFIYGGGDLWVELFGDKHPRQALWKMFLLNLAARIMGKKIIYIGCGAGKLSGFSLILAKASAHLANKVILRDAVSAATLGIDTSSVLPDLTITLFPNPPKIAVLPKDKPVHIVISLLYYIPDAEKNFDSYIQALAEYINQLDRDRFRITLLPMLTAPKTKHNDIWASENLLKRLKNPNNVKINTPKSFEDALAILSTADLVIGSRLHANILATWLGKPCIGIAYRPKISSFFKQNSLEEYCLEINETPGLKEKFDKLYTNYEAVAQQFLEASRRNLSKRKLYEDFANKYF